MQINVPLPPRRKRLVAAGCMTLYACVMCINMYAPIILPKMLAELGGMDYFAFAMVANGMGIMISAPVVGKIGDALGRKWLTIAALAVHMVLTLALSLSRSTLLFMALYLCSGVVLGTYISMPFAIIGDITRPEEKGRYSGLLAASGAVGMLLGPLLCGLIVDAGHLRAAFYVSFPLMIGSALLLLFYPNRPAPGKREPIDLPGLVLLVTAVACIASYINFGGSKFPRLSPAGLALAAVGLLAGALFFRHVHRVSNPIADIQLFRDRNFSTAWLIRFLFTAYLLCATSYLVLYAQNILHVSATVSSTLTMPQTLCMILLSPVIGAAVGRSGRNFGRLYITMGVCTLAALLLWCRIRPDSSLLLLYTGMLGGGVAYAIEQSISTPYFQLSISPEKYGAAQGLSFFASSAGSTMWGAVYGAILAGGELADQAPRIFLTGAVITAPILLLAVLRVKPPAALEDPAAPAR